MVLPKELIYGSVIAALIAAVGVIGSDRKQSSKKAELDASVRPATIADPLGSDVPDISAETSESAETTDAAGAVARPRSSDDGRASHASVNEDAVGSSCADAPAPRATPAESKPLAPRMTNGVMLMGLGRPLSLGPSHGV